MFDNSYSAARAESTRRDQSEELKRRREARRLEGISLLEERVREGELSVEDEGAEGASMDAALAVEPDAAPDDVPLPARQQGSWPLAFLALALVAALVLKPRREMKNVE